MIKELSEITLRFHLNALFVSDFQPGTSSKMAPVKRRFEVLLTFSQRSAGYLPAGNQD